MGAAAWGDLDRATNPYYQSLRQIVVLQMGGKVLINRAMANWHISRRIWFPSTLSSMLSPTVLVHACCCTAEPSYECASTSERMAVVSTAVMQCLLLQLKRGTN
eukprot:179318-Amphidinium_carterae.1